VDDNAEEIARVERYRRKLMWMKTPRERLQLLEKLQKEAWAILRSSPQGYAHYLRRNYKKRATNYREPNG
jgi:hypothetical protein